MDPMTPRQDVHDEAAAPQGTEDRRRRGASIRRRMARLPLTCTLGLAALIGTAGLTGCAPSGEAAARLGLRDDVLAAAPADGMIDVLILAGGAREPGRRLEDRPVRLVLAADGTMFAAFQGPIEPWTVPTPVRVLDRRDVAATWALARSLGLAEPAEGDRPINPHRVDVDREALVVLLTMQADERSWSVRTDVGPDEVASGAVVELVRHLGGLAWAADPAREDVPVIPKRYDLGPDPYERYRDAGAAR